ncbi:MAG: hypothetical protein IME96_09735 [Proteobacteria bacterium]|nr:hypothetical protein [Pseudomonadota bacterium]
MGIEIKGNRIIVNEKHMDMNNITELCRVLLELLNKRRKKILIDLNQVESISTHGIQLLIIADEYFKDLRIESVNPLIKNDLKIMGISI